MDDLPTRCQIGGIRCVDCQDLISVNADMYMRGMGYFACLFCGPEERKIYYCLKTECGKQMEYQDDLDYAVCMECDSAELPRLRVIANRIKTKDYKGSSEWKFCRSKIGMELV